MADRNYTITIKIDGESSARSQSPIAGSTKQSDTEEVKKYSFEKDASGALKKLVSYKAVKSFATQIVNHEISQVELRTGSRELQDRATFINETVQRGLGIVEGVALGAVAGGPIGAVIGALVGVTHTAISYAQRQDTLNLQRSIENASIQMNYIRAGANGSRRG